MTLTTRDAYNADMERPATAWVTLCPDGPADNSTCCATAHLETATGNATDDYARGAVTTFDAVGTCAGLHLPAPGTAFPAVLAHVDDDGWRADGMRVNVEGGTGRNCVPVGGVWEFLDDDETQDVICS